MNILLTGGAGYIGSHTAVALAKVGARIVLYDNLCNSDASVVKSIAKIVGYELTLVCGDINNIGALEKTLRDFDICAVLHFAALKSISESQVDPLKYYENNLKGSISVLQAMALANVKTLVFSSSATVYCGASKLPHTEESPTNPISAYGKSKLAAEHILEDICRSDQDWRITILRYFNPVGAHESGLIGEQPSATPNNLMPIILETAKGRRKYLNIFGSDYPTIDGTGVRDYVHVMDIAEGHVSALHFLQEKAGIHHFNLGTGKGTSVLEMVTAFECATNIRIPLKFAERRAGDLAESVADPTKANTLLGWTAARSMDLICSSAWSFSGRARI